MLPSPVMGQQTLMCPHSDLIVIKTYCEHPCAALHRKMSLSDASAPHFFFPSAPKEKDIPAPTTKAPAMALPMVTGIKFLTKMSAQLNGAPEKIPAGRMNMFATECSNPMAMNMEIGNQTPTILPERSLAMVHSHTAMQTNQLHMMPFTTVCPNVAEHFFITVWTAISCAPPVNMPVYLATASISKQPQMLPMYAIVQLRIKSLVVHFFS
eukprot:Skav234880  [mRNA]  locus=scaffold840:378651:379280:+ [translate_table: standard]